MIKAAGTRINLLMNEPLATAQTTGNSRAACTPATCSAFRARSSPSTPAVFYAATLVMRDTSSNMVVMSSSKAKRLPPAMRTLLISGCLCVCVAELNRRLCYMDARAGSMQMYMSCKRGGHYAQRHASGSAKTLSSRR